MYLHASYEAQSVPFSTDARRQVIRHDNQQAA
jgi:hypothetical protein